MARPLTDSERNNFQTLLRAAEYGDLALVETDLVVDIPKQSVAALVAIGQDGEESVMTPFAIMLPGNPYEMLGDPTT